MHAAANMRGKRTPLLGLLAAVAAVTAAAALLAPRALAWDTKEAGLGGDHKGKWVSMYACLGGLARYPETDCSHNEHERLANLVLERLIGGDSEWFIGGSTDLRVVDLNASLYRPELRARGTWPAGAGANGPLEIRSLADPPHWAGVPDFSYSIFDWINKNAFCPPLPLNRQNDPDCHVYKLYHGGIFNSSHWAKQDELGYRRLHLLAVTEARRAAALRRMIESAGPAEAEAYRDVIREAELLAMAYEGYAQHFLQDRWAMGHMWNRWGGPDHRGYPYWDKKSQAALVGGFVGILHGAEAIVGSPDAMSSPAPTLSILAPVSGGGGLGGYTFPGGVSVGSINEMEWAFPKGVKSGGLGDYRMDDLFDEQFGAGWYAFRDTDWPLNVRQQRGWLISCSAAGWREVITALGPNTAAGGYGLQGLTLTDLGANGLSELCFKPYATNRSMRDGWGFRAHVENAADPLAGLDMNFAVIGRLLLAAFFAQEVRVGDLPESILDRASLMRITNYMAITARFDPDGTDLAEGALPDWGDARTSEAYPLASYFEPADLDTLPDRSEDGRDKQTVFGFFNRAKAGHYCRMARDKTLFGDLRGQPEPERRAACRYLADRLFAGTPTDYAGGQAVVRRVDGQDSATIAPLCSLQPVAAERVTGEAFDEAVPHYIHPGYVTFDHDVGEPRGYAPDRTSGYSTALVGAWCDMRPVLDTVADEALRNRDVVAEITDENELIVLKGYNLGDDDGEIRIGESWTRSVVVSDIRGWRNGEIRLRLGRQLDELTFNRDDEAYVFLRRAPSRRGGIPEAATSVGRFVIRKSMPSPAITGITVRAGGEEVYSDKPPPPTPISDIPPGEDPPPGWSPPPPGTFRAIGPGRELEVTITFDRDMDRRAKDQAFKVGGAALIGSWTGARTWKGKAAVPADAPYRTDWRGYRGVSVSAKASRGGWYDGDPNAAGIQPATGHSLLFDLPPTWVERVRVRGGGQPIYDARWSDGPDYDKAINWVVGIWKALDRRLTLAVAKAPPASGQGQIRIDLSAETVTPPVVKVGGATAAMTGAGKAWTGTFDFAAARTRMDGPDIPIEISITDRFERDFDADPRSPTLVVPYGRVGSSGLWWTTNEAALGQSTSEKGGPDRRHKLGDPPELSLVVILDKSGSMSDSGRIDNARTGVIKAFAGLPPGRRIEMAAVVFDGCGEPNVTPFTRDLAAVKAFLLAARPGGSTAIARAHEVAADLFASSASPAARRWRYVTFTDGLENCGGDAAAALRRLQGVIDDHRGTLRAAAPEPPVKREEEPVDCRPQSWRAWEARVQDARILPGIRLVEHWYYERQLADGRCLVRLASTEYGVFYGSSGARRKWGVNSRPGKAKIEFASSQNGAAGVRRVRGLAEGLRGKGSDLATARKAIAKAVGDALDRLADAGGPARGPFLAFEDRVLRPRGGPWTITWRGLG